jgi:hypothetical protein
VAFDRAKTSLAQIEDKLRKVFGLAGTIGAQLDPTLTPSYVMGDARDPGTSGFKGRHWAWCSRPTPATTVGTWGLTSPVPIIIRGFEVSGMSAGTRLHVHVVASDHPALASWVGNRPCGTWIDQKASETDATPLLDRAVAVGAIVFANQQLTCVASFDTVNVANSTAGAQGRTFDRGIHIPAGGALLFQIETAGGAGLNGFFSAWGEIA